MDDEYVSDADYAEEEIEQGYVCSCGHAMSLHLDDFLQAQPCVGCGCEDYDGPDD